MFLCVCCVCLLCLCLFVVDCLFVVVVVVVVVGLVFCFVWSCFARVHVVQHCFPAADGIGAVPKASAKPRYTTFS